LFNGYIGSELELPARQCTAIGFIANRPWRNLYINLIIIDEDNEYRNDINWAPPIDMKHYDVNMPIRPYQSLFPYYLLIIDVKSQWNKRLCKFNEY